jgi:hypothetical protein
MKLHNGMRPQDMVILLQLLSIESESWQYRDVAASLFVSISEVSESLQRSSVAALFDNNLRKVKRLNLMEFLQHGLHYVFPAQPGTIVTGLPTGHSHPHFKTKIVSEMAYVWAYEQGHVRGLSIDPLYKTVPKACVLNKELYLLLAAIDVIRVGRVREKKLAMTILKEKIAP